MSRKDFTARNKPRTRRPGARRRGDWPGYGPDAESDGYRRRRLAAARQEKRGRQARFIFTVGIIAAALVFVAVFLIVRAGGSGSDAVVSEPVIIDDPGSGNIIFMGKDDSGHLAQLMVLAGAGQGGHGLMTIPARTVVQTEAAGFQRLDKLYDTGGQLQLDQAVANLLQIPIRYHVTFGYDALGALVEPAGLINLKTGKALNFNQSSGGLATLPAGDNPTAPTAAAALLKAAISDSKDGPLAVAVFYQGLRDALAARPENDRKKMIGDLLPQVQTDLSSGDLTSLLMAVTAPGGAFVASALPVRAVGAGDAWYFEPAMDELGAITGSASQETPVQMEIRNGTELNGMVEAAATRLEPLSYTTSLSSETSGGNYETTQIRCGSDAVSAGSQVRAQLGAGDVIKDDSMEKQQIIVIIGRDLSVALTGQS